MGSMQRGFSLVELLVVLGILGVLALALLANYRTLRVQALERGAQAHGGAVAQALGAYLALYLGESPTSLMGGQLQALPPGDTSGAPDLMPTPAGSRSCTDPYTLTAPGGGSTPYSWPRAPRGTGCILALDAASRFAVYTWAHGGRRYYVNGQTP